MLGGDVIVHNLCRNSYKRCSNKCCLKKHRFYPSFLYHRLDKWLKIMSQKGWHLVHSTEFSFIFEEGEKEDREYFTYGLITQEGKYNISLMYPMLEKTYGLKISKLNKNQARFYRTIEIDKKQIETKHKVGYNELISDRNRLYKKYFIRNTIILSVVILSLVLLFSIS